jgi:NAD(P)-dependent dehydrogenase (short-subunit alcohol dehydrogenase family)
LERKICVVTGANRGIGLGIIQKIAKQGHHAVLVCRNTDMGKKVLNSLLYKYGKKSASMVEGNLSSIKTTGDLGKALLEEHDRFDALIHNAGVWPSRLTLNDDGIEIAFMVNHLAPFYLTHLLLSRLKESAPSRIVLVNAGLYPRGNFDLELTPWGKDFSRFKTYMNSKFCSILYMRKFAPMLEGSKVLINAVHPGVIRTGLVDFKGLSGIMIFRKPIEFGARGPVNLALNPDIKTNGSYYDKLEKKELAKKVLDDNLARILWDLSLELCSIKEYGN